MNIPGLLFLIIVALVITLFFSYALRLKGPWGSFWTFFIVLFLAIWAADIWVTPVGPYWNDIYWTRPIIVGFFIAILLAAAVPSPRARSKMENEQDVIEPEPVLAAVGIFFWITILVMVALVISGLLINV